MDATISRSLPAKVVVLGATGFLGRAVVRGLLEARHQVRVLVRDPNKAAAVLPAGVKMMTGDGLNMDHLMAACQGADYAVSLVAARRNVPQSFLEVNVDGPRRLGEAAKAHGLKSVVFVSAIGADLDPHFKYLSSRWMGEEELKRSDTASTILRFSPMLGPDGGICRDFERRAEFGPAIVIPGSGEAQYQPIVREDAAHCIVAAVGREDLANRTLNLGGPEVLTYEQLLQLFLETRGIKKRTVKVPVQLLTPPVWAMELFFADPVWTPDEILTAERDHLADGLDVVAANFGFRPQSPTAWIPQNWSQPLAA